MQLELFKIHNNCRPPLRYPGSKYGALKIIQNYLPEKKYKFFCEPFFGSGAFFFKIVDPETKSIINDYDKDLINFYKQIKNREIRKKIITKCSKFNPSKSRFELLKNKKPVNNLEKAINYFLINRTAYSGIMKQPNWGYHKDKSVKPDKWAERIENAGIKLKNTKIHSSDFRTFFSRKFESETFFFIDPPYYAADQKRAYEKSFKTIDHIDLGKILKKLKFKFLLTYDDTSEIRNIYKWANLHSVSWRYHTANSKKATRKKGKELIITNY